MGCGASAEAQQFNETIRGPLENSRGEYCDAGTLLEAKYKLILFSVDAPGHIERTLGQLVPLLDILKQRQIPVEMVLVSDDHTEAAYKAHLAKVPSFYAVPWSDVARRQQLHYILGLPQNGLAVMDKDGSVITVEGLQVVDEDPRGDDFPWKPSKAEGIFDALGD